MANEGYELILSAAVIDAISDMAVECEKSTRAKLGEPKATATLWAKGGALWAERELMLAVCRGRSTVVDKPNERS